MVRGRLTVNGAKKRGRIALLLAGEFSLRPRGTITTLAVAGACCEVEVWAADAVATEATPTTAASTPNTCMGFRGLY
jgi:hypothetical protein